MALGSEISSPVAANFPIMDQPGAAMVVMDGQVMATKKPFLTLPAPDCIGLRRRRSNCTQPPTAFNPGKSPSRTSPPAFVNDQVTPTPTPNKEELKNALRNRMQSLANSKFKVTPFFRKKNKDRTSKPCSEEARRIRNRFCQARKRQQTREAIAKLEFNVQSATAENLLLKNSLKLMQKKYNQFMSQDKHLADEDTPLNLSESLPSIGTLTVNEKCAFPPLSDSDDQVPLVDRITSDPSTSPQGWMIPSISVTDTGQDVAHSWPGALKAKYSFDSSDYDTNKMEDDDVDDNVDDNDDERGHISSPKRWPSDGLSPAISMMLNTDPVVPEEDVEFFGELE